MFIFIVVFTLKRSKERKKVRQEEHEKIKEYGALEKFDKAAKTNMSDMNNYSKILYNNFKKLL